LILAPVIVEAGAVVGARSVLMPGVVVGANSTVKAMSHVTMNTVIPPNEVWGGIPARKM
jgi:acetyltransferase-like isoleucine patch superfamily enzyme